MTKKIYKAAIYARTATAEQTGHSTIDSQVKELSGYAKAKGWRIAKVHKDVGVSGLSEDRPALSKLLVMCKAKEVDTVLISDRTRLARGFAPYCLLEQKFKKLGVKLIFLNG